MRGSFVVRPAILNDAEGIARVRVDTWRATYRGLVQDSYLESLSYADVGHQWRRFIELAQEEKERRTNLVAECCDGIIGFAAGGPEREGKDGYDGELYAMYVLPHHQGRGVGKALFDGFRTSMGERDFGSMLAWVLSDNPNRYFYERQGGVFVRDKSVDIGERTLIETGYGFTIRSR